MKKIKSIYIRALVVLACVLLSTKTNAQFDAALITEVSVSAGAVSMNARFTGNDIKDFGGTTYAVSVWDDNGGTRSGIGWRVGSTPTVGYLPFNQTTDIYDPDVCLIDNTSDIYAIVAYYKGGGSNTYYWEMYRWIPGTSTAFSYISSTVCTTGTFGTSLNVDGNNAGDFAIVWDETTKGFIKTGSTAANSVPALNNGGAAVPISNGSNICPDVSILTGGGNNRVYVSYLSSSNVNAGWATFASIAAGGCTLTGVLNASPGFGYTFYVPRIATPNGTAGWTVVVEESNGSIYNIKGFNNCCGNTAKIYNDGSGNSPLNISGEPNHYPVVAYDDQSPDIWIGWTMNNSSGNITPGPPPTQAIYPLVLKCTNQGGIPANSTYWEAPLNLNTNDHYDMLSLAGRFASDKLFVTFLDGITSDVWHKIIPSVSMASELKSSSSSLFDQEMADNAMFSDLKNSDLLFTVRLINLNGNVVLVKNGTFNQIRETFLNQTANIPASIYLAEIISDDGSIYFSKKILLGN